MVATLSILGGAIVYHIQKSVDRQMELQKERRALYRRYVILFEDLNHKLLVTGPENPESLALVSEIIKVTTEILIAAPDTVVEACKNVPSLFARLGKLSFKESDDFDETERQLQEDKLNEAKSKIISAMRNDTYENTRIRAVTIKDSISGFMISIGAKDP